MRKTLTTGIIVALLGTPALASAADKCPAELAQAKSMLNKAAASAKTTTTAPRQLAGARTQDVQAPRTASQDVQAPRTGSQDVQAPRTGAQDVQAPRTGSQDVQAPRTGSQDVQAPRTASQDVQAPRTTSQDVQAPRAMSQDVQAPRGQDEQATRLSNARKLIGDAEAACKKGDMATSSSKAKEAIAQLK
jgi:hypothetical protein